jgi:hypothetical protein
LSRPVAIPAEKMATKIEAIVKPIFLNSFQKLKCSRASYPDAPNWTEIVLDFGDHPGGMVPSLIYRRECFNAESQPQGERT